MIALGAMSQFRWSHVGFDSSDSEAETARDSEAVRRLAVDPGVPGVVPAVAPVRPLAVAPGVPEVVPVDVQVCPLAVDPGVVPAGPSARPLRWSDVGLGGSSDSEAETVPGSDSEAVRPLTVVPGEVAAGAQVRPLTVDPGVVPAVVPVRPLAVDRGVHGVVPAGVPVRPLAVDLGEVSAGVQVRPLAVDPGVPGPRNDQHHRPGHFRGRSRGVCEIPVAERHPNGGGGGHLSRPAGAGKTTIATAPGVIPRQASRKPLGAGLGSGRGGGGGHFSVP